MARSSIRACKYCGGQIFFDDQIAKARPLDYDGNGQPQTHKCKQFRERTQSDRPEESDTTRGKPAQPTSVQIKVMEQMQKDIAELKNKVKRLEEKVF